MKDIVIQLLLSIILTVVGIFVGVGFSMGEEHSVVKNCAILFVILCNALWLIPYSIAYFRRKQMKKMYYSITICLIFVSPFIIIRFYQKPFNSEEWKTEIDYNKTYGEHRCPTHTNGYMAQEIIDSKMLIGLSLDEIEKQLGKNYVLYDSATFPWFNDTVLDYPYSGGFDNCDQLSVTIKNGRCVEANYGGCD